MNYSQRIATSLVITLFLACAFVGGIRAQSGSNSSINFGVSSVNGCTGVCTINVTQFVNGFTPSSPGTVAGLISGSPCVAGLLGQYAVVSDLYSSASATNEVMRCTLSGSNYYWRPQRTDFVANFNTTGGSVTATCMVSPPTMFFTGSLLTNFNIALSKSNCWPGARFDIANNITLNVSGVTVTGLISSTTKILGLNAHYTFVYDGADWQFYQ